MTHEAKKFVLYRYVLHAKKRKINNNSIASNLHKNDSAMNNPTEIEWMKPRLMLSFKMLNNDTVAKNRYRLSRVTCVE